MWSEPCFVAEVVAAYRPRGYSVVVTLIGALRWGGGHTNAFFSSY